MKKALSLMMALVMACSLVGCKDNGENTESAEEVKEVELTPSNIQDYVLIDARYTDFSKNKYDLDYSFDYYIVDLNIETALLQAGKLVDAQMKCKVYLGEPSDEWAAYMPDEYVEQNVDGYVDVIIEFPMNGVYRETIGLCSINDASRPTFSAKKDLVIESVSGTFIKD